MLINTGIFAAMVWLAMVCGQISNISAEGITTNPIQVQPTTSSFLIRAQPFVQLPATQDASKPTAKINDFVLYTNAARTRLQNMMPLGDGSGRLAISDLRGVLYLVNEDGSGLSTYLDLRQATDDLAMHVFPNEAGLLGFAFHPQFGQSGSPGYGKFYTAYSAQRESGEADFMAGADASHHSVIRQWTAHDHRHATFSGSSTEIIRIGQFAVSHNIGTLAFNPAAAPGSADFGALYFSMGDGGGAFDPMQNGQNPRTPLGTLMRIQPLAAGNKKYAIPADNPFVGRSGYLPEIWAWGIRHAQHFSFARNGRMYINDIGQNLVEEVNIGVKGANYGWPVREGMFLTGQAFDDGYLGALYPLSQEVADTDTYTYPVAQYDHDDVVNAISSGFLYEGQAIKELQGQYVFADLVQGTLYSIPADYTQTDGAAPITQLRVHIAGREQPIAAVVAYENTYTPDVPRADLRLGMDERGELYILTKGDGMVRKLVPQR